MFLEIDDTAPPLYDGGTDRHDRETPGFMCGIVGLFLKDKALEPQLGALLAGMLEVMTDRGAGQRRFRGLWRGRSRPCEADSARCRSRRPGRCDRRREGYRA
ncbi:hypothetical protein ACFSTD_22485 [Novosphingobium colocasiae]